jgi:hypothetical protein
MSNKSFKFNAAKEKYNEFKKHGWNTAVIKANLIDQFDDDLRNKLVAEQNRMITNGSIQVDSYEFDVEFGIFLYEYLDKCSWFNIRLACDDDFWRWLSMEIIPEMVVRRWPPPQSGASDDSHRDRLYANKRRMWLKAIWWYVHLTFNVDLQTTKQMLIDFTSDSLVQITERVGRGGYRVELCREIAKQYHSLLYSYTKNKKEYANLLRKVMKKNTAWVQTRIPALHPNKEQGYVEELFKLFV